MEDKYLHDNNSITQIYFPLSLIYFPPSNCKSRVNTVHGKIKETMTQGDAFQAIESGPLNRDISSLNFSPTVSSLLLSSAWDASLTLHDISRNIRVNSWTFEAPLLDCRFSLDGNMAYTAGLGRVVTGCASLVCIIQWESHT